MDGERQLTRIYSAAGRELRSLLLELDIENLNEMKAMEIEKHAKRVTFGLNLAAHRWAGRYLPGAYRAGAARSRTALEILGRKPKPRFARPGSGPQAIVESATTYLIKANGSMGRIVERYLSVALLARKTYSETSGLIQEFSFNDAAWWLSRFATAAVKAEQSRGDLKRRILNYLRGLISDDNFIEIKGKMWRAGKYAELVARTTLRDAQTKATKDLCAQYENDLIQWSDHATDCPICIEFEGKVYSLSGATPGYPIIPEEPPAHPNCKHSLLPTSVEAIEARARWS